MAYEPAPLRYIFGRYVLEFSKPMTRTVPAQSVLLLGTDLSTGGGVNRVIVDLAHLLHNRLGMRVTIASARSDAPSSYTIPDNVDILQGRRGGILAYLRFLWRLRSQPFDAVISFWGQDNILALLMLFGSGKQVVVCEHTSFHNATASVQLARRLIYRYAEAVTVLNRRELAHYTRYLANVSLVPNPVRPLRPPRSDRDKVILGVGHLVEKKGFADLIEAYARSGVFRKGWALRIIGDGPDRPRLEALIAKYHLEMATILPPTNDITQVYAAAQIIVVPSHLDVFSLVLAEGAISGLIPLAYDIDGPAYLLEQFPELLVPEGNVELLAERLGWLCRGNGPDPTDIARVMGDLTSPETITGYWRSLLAGRRRVGA